MVSHLYFQAVIELTLSNFTDKALEGQLADEEFGALLVATNFAKSDGTRAEAVRLLYTTCLSGSLARLLGRELFAWGLATSGFAGSLLSSESVKVQVKEAGQNQSRNITLTLVRAIADLDVNKCWWR
jgi:hypothetical protein